MSTQLFGAMSAEGIEVQTNRATKTNLPVDVKNRTRAVIDPGLPAAQGLYDPLNEKDSCGVGFIADMKGRKSHKIIQDGIQILLNLEHRGAVGADPRAGDGAGMLVQLPDAFFRKEAAKLGFELPEPGHYAVGFIFFPRDAEGQTIVREAIEKVIADEGQVLLGWRDVPTDNASLGESVKPTEPLHKQIFVARGPGIESEDEFERRLFVLRKVISNLVYDLNDPRTKGYYPVSLSCRTIVYKGMFLADQLGAYFPDLHDPSFESALALVHQRFSTNTFPAWSLAHPYRMVAHNGEINTLRGNVNWMAARQASVDSELFGNDISKLWPVSYEGQSDTACFDNALEFLVQGGYSLAHAVMMLVPEAWAGNKLMDEQRRAFYEYHAAIMEPWDGPAAIAFTDCRQIGATLDRNGLRPAPGSSPRTTASSWPRKWACCPFPRATSSASGACSRARCCSSTSPRAASSPTRRSRPISRRPTPTGSGWSVRSSSSRTFPRSSRAPRAPTCRCSISSRPSATPRRT